ncbi:hypothetical protein V1521DRAFT_375118 [Lipomyces starkeyi]
MNVTLSKAPDGREKSIRATKRTSYGLDEQFESHDDFIEIISSFMEQHDSHAFDADAHSLRFRATLAECFVIENDVSVGSCAQTNDQSLQKRAIKCFRNDIFDCTGYYFHLRRCNERVDGPRFSLTCSRSNERRTGERDPSSVQRYTTSREFFECHGDLHISFSKSNRSATIIYDHKCHAEAPKFRITEEIQQYIKAQQLLAPRQIYQNLIQLADTPQFAKTDLHTITRQQVYNVWLSLAKREWERDGTDDFRSAQLLVGEHSGFQLIPGLQEPGVSLAFATPYSTFGTNRHGYELYCVITEYDLVSIPLSYLLLDTRGVQEVGKRGSRLTTWLMALRDAGLKPGVVHTDKDFAEVTAAAIAFKRENPGYKHHLCLWHSLRAIDQHITGKARPSGSDTIENARSSIRSSALPSYLRFLSEEADWILSKGHTKLCTSEQAGNIRSMVKRHLLRHPILPKVVYDNTIAPQALVFETYEYIHASSVRELLDYCKSIGQPKLFRYFWNNWYRPEYGGIASRWEIASLCGRPDSDTTIPISRTTMRIESHWRILKKDYASRFVRPRLDVLCYIVITGLVRSRIHLQRQVQLGREKPSSYKDFVQLWRKCAEAVDNSAILKRAEIYHTDKDKWVCSCPSFVLNSRYICKHLVSFYSSRSDNNGPFVVRLPPTFNPELFQERWPLVKFNEHELIGPDIIGQGVELNDCADEETNSLTYAEELASLQLLPAEDPEGAEEDDEEAMEILRVMHWASGEQCKFNPRMQRNICSFIPNKKAFLAQFKRPYEEALGHSRSIADNTMRKAPRTYFHMRPQNQSR